MSDVELKDERGTESILYTKVKTQINTFSKEANKHSFMHRFLWVITSVLSILVAITTNHSFELWGISSAGFASVISILVPITASYIILRSPESLWVNEIKIRNKLKDLQFKIELRLDKDAKYDLSDLEDAYFSIMEQANSDWLNQRQKK